MLRPVSFAASGGEVVIPTDDEAVSRLDQRAIDTLCAYKKAEHATGFDPAPGPAAGNGRRRRLHRSR